jgi:hypothetical protein
MSVPEMKTAASDNSSVGGVGREERSFGRDYWTYGEAVTLDNVDDFMRDTENFLPNFQEDVSRNVMRSVMGVAALRQVLNGSTLRNHIEAVAPLSTGEYLTYFANNNISKRGRSPYEDWRYDANIPVEDMSSPERNLPEGYEFISHEDVAIAALQEIWRPFDWSESAVEGRLNELTEAKKQNPEDRRVWWAGIANAKGRLVSAATAEGIVLPSSTNDKSAPVVEYTEFATLPDERGKKLMVQVVRKLIESVHDDLGDDVDGIAECNIFTKSYHSAIRAGLQVSNITAQDGFTVNNVLRQNVGIVNDMGDSELRDFLLLYLPKGEQS